MSIHLSANVLKISTQLRFFGYEIGCYALARKIMGDVPGDQTCAKHCR